MFLHAHTYECVYAEFCVKLSLVRDISSVQLRGGWIFFLFYLSLSLLLSFTLSLFRSNIRWAMYENKEKRISFILFQWQIQICLLHTSFVGMTLVELRYETSSLSR